MRYTTDTVLAIYVKEPKVQTSYPAMVSIYGSRPKTFEPDDREADEAHRDLQHEGEGFGTKPEDISAAQWGALKKLHLNLSHPSAHALKRRLKSYGVSQEVWDAVDKLDCAVCKELGRPNTTRPANLKLSTEFNENVFLDEAEVILSDKTRLMVMVILDDASSLRVIVPTTAVRSITCEGESTLLLAGMAVMGLTTEDALLRRRQGSRHEEVRGYRRQVQHPDEAGAGGSTTTQGTSRTRDRLLQGPLPEDEP